MLLVELRMRPKNTLEICVRKPARDLIATDLLCVRVCVLMSVQLYTACIYYIE